MLLGLHLAQTTALASVAPCEVRGDPVASASMASTDVVSIDVVSTDVVGTTHVAAHDHAAMHHEPAAPAAPNNEQHSQSPSVCSMAMACAVVASPTTPVALPTVRDRLLDERRPTGPAVAQATAPHAPEPPPPKS